MKTIIEPFRIKCVEPIRMSTKEYRERVLCAWKQRPTREAKPGDHFCQTGFKVNLGSQETPNAIDLSPPIQHSE